MARIFNIYGVTEDRTEVFVESVSTPAQGKTAHVRMKQEGVYEYIRCRDVLGGLRFEFNLETERKTA